MLQLLLCYNVFDFTIRVFLTVSFRYSEDLMATLSILDMKHHKVIHGMVWQVESDRFESYKESDVGKFKRRFPTMSIIMLFLCCFRFLTTFSIQWLHLVSKWVKIEHFVLTKCAHEVVSQ